MDRFPAISVTSDIVSSSRRSGGTTKLAKPRRSAFHGVDEAAAENCLFGLANGNIPRYSEILHQRGEEFGVVGRDYEVPWPPRTSSRQKCTCPEPAPWSVYQDRASAGWYRETGSGRVHTRHAPPWEMGGAACPPFPQVCRYRGQKRRYLPPRP